MKKILVLSVLLLTLCSCNQKEMKKEVEIKPITCSEMKEKLKENAYLVDVRTEAEFRSGTIEGAINVPVEKFKQEIEGIVLTHDETVILFCRSGNRSAKAAEYLKELGYENIFDLGSIDSCNE